MVTGPLQMETFAAVLFLRFSLEKPQKQLGSGKTLEFGREPPLRETMRGPADAKEYTGAFVMEDEIRSSAHRKRSCRQCRDPKHSGASVQAFVFALSKYPFCCVQ